MNTVNRNSLLSDSPSVRWPFEDCSAAPSWAIRSLVFYHRAPLRELPAGCITLGSLRLTVAPQREQRNRTTGEWFVPGYMLRVSFHSPCDGRLMALSDAALALAESTAECPWLLLPGLRVHRIDIASDHLVPFTPDMICDKVARVTLPYCNVVRWVERGGDGWPYVFHSASAARSASVTVAHYPLAATASGLDAEGSARWADYAASRVRQEVRFRSGGIRRRIHGGRVTVQRTLAALPLFMRAAAARVGPIYEAGILVEPERDSQGEAAIGRLSRLLNEDGARERLRAWCFGQADTAQGPDPSA